MSKISINLFPLATDQFTVTLYRLPFNNIRPKSGEVEAVMRQLNVDGEYKPYWTCFQKFFREH